MSLCENICADSLRTVLHPREEIKRNLRPFWLTNPHTGNRLEYDFYLPRCAIAIELQGQHHYEDEYQKYKDTIKRDLSLKNGVHLLELSTTQIGPLTLYRKLFNIKIHESNHPVTLLKFDTNWIQKEKEVVTPYRKMVKQEYGVTEANTAPGMVKYLEEKKEKEKLLNYLDTIEISHQGERVRALFLSSTKKKVMLRILGTDKIIYYPKNKILKNLGVTQVRPGIIATRDISA